MGDRDVIETVSEVLRELASSPGAITAVVVVGAGVSGWLLVKLLRVVVARATAHTSSTWDDELAHALSAPVSLIVALQALRVASPWLHLDPHVQGVLETANGTLTTVLVVWAIFRSIDLGRHVLEGREWARERPASVSLLKIGARFAKVAVVILAAILALSQLGVSVASLIAGLGIGGLVIALAAQKTVENLFGTVSIGIDQPMREGDFIRVYDFVGTVEQIGLRSTRIRTLDRTLVTIPNGELSNQRVESFSVRDRIRLACTVGLVYRTTAAQLRRVLTEMEGVLRAHPKIWPDSVIVRFKELAASSLDIEVMAWFETSDWNEFQLIRQDILIGFMEVVEAAGSSIAFPTRTVHLEHAAVHEPIT